MARRAWLASASRRAGRTARSTKGSAIRALTHIVTGKAHVTGLVSGRRIKNHPVPRAKGEITKARRQRASNIAARRKRSKAKAIGSAIAIDRAVADNAMISERSAAIQTAVGSSVRFGRPRITICAKGNARNPPAATITRVSTNARPSVGRANVRSSPVPSPVPRADSRSANAPRPRHSRACTEAKLAARPRSKSNRKA